MKKNAPNAGNFYSLSGSGGSPRLIFVPLAIQKFHYGGLSTTNEGIKCQFCGQLLNARLVDNRSAKIDDWYRAMFPPRRIAFTCTRTIYEWIAECPDCKIYYSLKAAKDVIEEEHEC